jgi:hypothetical protein
MEDEDWYGCENEAGNTEIYGTITASSAFETLVTSE